MSFLNFILKDYPYRGWALDGQVPPPRNQRLGQGLLQMAVSGLHPAGQDAFLSPVAIRASLHLVTRTSTMASWKDQRLGLQHLEQLEVEVAGG